jgi:HD-GYP domain-containing protein (c-di-GMP phosphodiesterase class II)
VFDELRNCSGTHFDPQIVEIFFDNLDEILEIKAQFPASDPPSTSVPPPAAKSEPQVDANASPASDSQAEIKKAS